MRDHWIEILRARMDEVEGAPGTFRNRAPVSDHPFQIEHSVRVILGAGELAPFSSVPHGHVSFYKGSPGGEDILLDANHKVFLVVKNQSSETPAPQKLELRLHTHFIPWEKIVDIEFVETKISQQG